MLRDARCWSHEKPGAAVNAGIIGRAATDIVCEKGFGTDDRVVVEGYYDEMSLNLGPRMVSGDWRMLREPSPTLWNQRFKYWSSACKLCTGLASTLDTQFGICRIWHHHGP